MFAKSIISTAARVAVYLAALAAAGPALARSANTVTTISGAANGNPTNLGQIATGDAGAVIAPGVTSGATFCRLGRIGKIPVISMQVASCFLPQGHRHEFNPGG